MNKTEVVSHTLSIIFFTLIITFILIVLSTPLFAVFFIDDAFTLRGLIEVFGTYLLYSFAYSGGILMPLSILFEKLTLNSKTKKFVYSAIILILSFTTYFLYFFINIKREFIENIFSYFTLIPITAIFLLVYIVVLKILNKIIKRLKIVKE